jgi:hypothetical protein
VLQLKQLAVVSAETGTVGITKVAVIEVAKTCFLMQKVPPLL